MSVTSQLPLDIDAVIGSRIATLRWRARFSPRRLASAAGMTVADLEACERGHRRLRAGELFRLCGALRASVSSVFAPLR